MAYKFASANSRYLSTSSSPASGSPMTMACWFAPVSPGGGQAIMSVGVSGGSQRNQLVATQSGSDFGLLVQAVGASDVGSPTAAAVSASGFLHAAGVFSSQTSRTAYLNGVAGNTDTTNIGTQATANSILIGARINSSVGLYFTGDVADAVIWNVALSANEISALAKGVSARLIRPQSIVFYAPLVRDLIDARGGLTITNNNTAAVSNHPRIYA